VEDQLRQVFARVFSVPPESVTNDSTPQSVAGWNSGGHLNLVLEIESEFNIQLSDEEVVAMVTFQLVQNTVARHLRQTQ